MQLTMKKRAIASGEIRSFAQPMSFHRVLHAFKTESRKAAPFFGRDARYMEIFGDPSTYLASDSASVAKFWSADRSVDGMFHAALGRFPTT